MEAKERVNNEEPIRVVHPICCGLDVQKEQVQACLLGTSAGGGVRQEQRSFGTTTEDLLALLDWLLAAGCTHVAMEGKCTSPCTGHVPFWFKPFSIFGVSTVTTFISGSQVLAPPIDPSSRPP
jgi:hypothetical protein